MRQPYCEKKEHLLAIYMEAVRTHYEMVGLLKALRHQPKSNQDRAPESKSGAYAMHSGQVRIGATL
jgi:hypothetical protein